MKTIKQTFTSLLILLCISSGMAQQRIPKPSSQNITPRTIYPADDSQQGNENTKTENPTFFEIQAAFNDYWKGKNVQGGKYLENGEEKKAYGWKQFKRWEWYWKQRVGKEGQFPNADVLWNEREKYQQAQYDRNGSPVPPSANWSFYGPTTSGGGYEGIGRLNCIAFHPTDKNTFYVGSPGGGLWKTTDGGSTWTTLTDNIAVLGISDIAIHPTTPDTIYIATGDGDAAHFLFGGGATLNIESIGILKSTNGGSTWSTTGLTWSITSQKVIRRLLIHPTNPQILLAAASDGIWRTTDGGTTWTNVQSSDWFIDIEFNPGNPSTVYATTYDDNGSAEFHRSTNEGLTWTALWVFPSAIRMKIGITAAQVNLVDLLCADTLGGFDALWTSFNNGSNFSLTYSPGFNLFEWDYNGVGSGGQGDYDLAYVINPTNANEVYAGGINTWKSANGGSSWAINNYWTTGQSAPVVHADKHFIRFHPLDSSLLYECNDGGLYVTNDGGINWNDITDGMGISQMYRIGTAQTLSNNVLCGLQDNSTKELYGTWSHAISTGDGMECIIDYTNANIEYTASYYGEIHKTSNAWGSSTIIVNSGGAGVDANGDWVTPYIMHPTNNNTLLVGKTQLYETTNGGNTWTQLGSISGLTGKIISIAYAPSNTNTIYIAGNWEIFKTTNGGSTWSLIGTSSNSMTYIAVDSTNSQRLWITNSGYSAGDKVWYSPNGGSNWYNWSGTLPNVPVNCIVYEPGSNDGLYIGTDVGVYYTNSSLNDWIPYNNGLPNIVVTELEISYSNNKLWAATYGRGLWRSDLATPPTADFTASSSNICVTDCINFFDNSTNSPTTWSWTFTGGVPSSSTASNPTSICYASAGTYPVTLSVSNGNGNDTITVNGYITVNVCTDIAELTVASTFEVYPNPNNGQFTIEFNSVNSTDIQLNIFNMIGESIYSETLLSIQGNYKNLLDLSDLSKGVYTIELISNEGKINRNLIIE
ncbi:MAG: T9SS type A sorting domain-containing protein [Bacteroidetes bacterium]|nr:T9SS type A sorting domain-containing protein [Bacteroidota bacterium]